VKVRRAYRQDARARATAQNTQRVVDAALELFLERPFEQVTLKAVAERAGVGLQSVVRRVGTKDGLVEMVNEWIGPQVAATLGDPATVSGPADVADRFCAHYQRWGRLIERTLHQSDVSPAVAANAERGRVAHRDWVVAAFAEALVDVDPKARKRLTARLVAVTGVEVFQILRRDEGLSLADTRAALTDLVSGCLTAPAQEKP
jgi:AcrR family transcriptional regulator